LKKKRLDDTLKLATIARLSIDGLWLAEIFGRRPFSKELQIQVFNELIAMIQEEK